MFFALAIVSMLGYSLQGTLLVRYARSMDGLSLAFYRNISFVVTLLPLLLFAAEGSIGDMLDQWPWLALAGLTGGLSLMMRFASYRSLPVGVSMSFTKVFTTIFLTGLGWVVFGEHLSWNTLLLLGLLLGGILWLGLQRNHLEHLDNRTWYGIGLATLTAFPLACTVFIHFHLSKTIDPFASSYFWEVMIGLASLVIVLGRRLVGGEPLQAISWRQFGMIAAASSPTLLGTLGIALAVRLGPVAIVSAINSVSLVFTALLAWWWYNEKLQKGQWLAIVFIVTVMAALQFAL